MLKRLLGRLPGTTRPDWSQPPEVRALVPMLLAGSWDESSEGDRLVIETLAGRPYREVVEVASRWRLPPDVAACTRWPPLESRLA